MNERTRDFRTGLFWMSYPDHPPEDAAPWLVPLPADAVFLFFGLRDFRLINNEFGVAFADRLLAAVGRRLAESADPWPAYRCAGDEFFVAARLPDDAALRALVAAIRVELERPYEKGARVGTWAAAAKADAGDSASSLSARLDRASAAVLRARSADLLIAPPDSSSGFGNPAA